MRLNKRKLFLLGLVPLMGAMIIPAISVSACGKSKQLPPPSPSSTIKKFSLNDVGLKDWYIRETDITQTKSDITEHVHDLINQKNRLLNDDKYDLKEGVDYSISGDDESSLADFVSLTNPTLEIEVSAAENDSFLIPSDVTFKTTNTKDISPECDLSSITLDSISLGSNNSSTLKSEITEEITQQLNQKFLTKLRMLHQKIDAQDWVIDDLESLIQKLVDGYQNGVTLTGVVRSSAKNALLINTANIKISNAREKMVYITNLAKNYTIQDYANGINQSRASINTMDQNAILSQIQVITGQLSEITTQVMNKVDIQLHWVNEEWPAWSMVDFQKAYKILSNNINPNFYWNSDYFIKKADELKIKPEFQAVFPTLLAYHLAESCLSAIKSEFSVHELFILINRFMELNKEDPCKWAQNIKDAIGNLALELNSWIDLQQFLGTIKMGDRQDWGFFYDSIMLKNLEFLQKDMKQYRTNFPYIIMGKIARNSFVKDGPHIAPPPKDLTRVIVKNEFVHNGAWRHESCTDVYLPNQSSGQVLFLPFATLSGTVTIDLYGN